MSKEASTTQNERRLSRIARGAKKIGAYAATAATFAGAATAIQATGDQLKAPHVITSTIGDRNLLAIYNRDVTQKLVDEVRRAIAPAQSTDTIVYPSGGGPEGSQSNGPEQKSNVNFAEFAQQTGGALLNEKNQRRLEEQGAQITKENDGVTITMQRPNGEIEYDVAFSQGTNGPNISDVKVSDYFAQPAGSSENNPSLHQSFEVTDETENGKWNAIATTYQPYGAPTAQTVTQETGGFAGNESVQRDNGTGDDYNYTPMTASQSEAAVVAVQAALNHAAHQAEG